MKYSSKSSKKGGKKGAEDDSEKNLVHVYTYYYVVSVCIQLRSNFECGCYIECSCSQSDKCGGTHYGPKRIG
jgi:hypothetical protein